ncbi:MAG TPA: CHAT domain-containing protein, partial [Bacteroidota bacterium]|nr:CHAT domain-containing protein [Bacteroidota bacterium]
MHRALFGLGILMFLAAEVSAAAPYSSDEYLALRRKIGLAQYPAAREDCLRMMDKYPHDAVLHETFVEICLYAGQIDEAETVLRRRLASGKGVEQCLYAIGLSRYHRHHFRDALDALTRSIKLGNNSPDCYKYLAYALEKMYGVDEAIRRLSMMSHEESGRPQLWYALGLSHLAKGNCVEAESAFAEAMERSKTEPVYQQLRAVASYCSGTLKDPEFVLLSLICAAGQNTDISSVQFLRWYLLHERSSNGDEKGWEALVRQSLGEAREFGQSHWEGWFQDARAAHALRHGYLSDAQNAAARSLKIAELIGDPDLAKGARRILIDSQIYLGEFGSALRNLNALITETDSAQFEAARSDVFIDAGRLMNEICRPNLALDLVANGLVRLGRARGNTHAEMRDKMILGSIYENLGDSVSALRNFEDAALLAKRAGVPDHELALSLGNLGRQYITGNQTHVADSLLKGQLSIAERHTFRADKVVALISLADLACRQRQILKGARLFGRAVELGAEIKMVPAQVIACTGLGDSMFKLGDLKKSIDAYKRAAQGYEKLYESLPAFVWGENEAYLEVLRKIVSINIALGSEDEALLSFERARGAAVQRMTTYAELSHQSLGREGEVSRTDFEAFSESLSQRFIPDMLSSSIDSGRSLEFVRYAARLSEAQARCVDLSHRQLASGPELLRIVQSHVRRSQAVIGYITSGEKLNVLCVTNDSFGWRQVPFDHINFAKAQSELDKSIYGHHNKSQGPLTSAAKPGFALLYHSLFDPIADVVKSKSEITFIPDGNLCSVPLEMLEDETGYALLKDHVVNYELSLSDYCSAASEVMPKRHALLFVGAADDGISQSLVFDNSYLSAPSAPIRRALPGVEKELNVLEECLGSKLDAIMAVGTGKSEVLSIAPSYGLVHIACHAIPDLEDPTCSIVSLGASSRNGSAKIVTLTPYDIAAHLWSAKFVFLNTCG